MCYPKEPSLWSLLFVYFWIACNLNIPHWRRWKLRTSISIIIMQIYLWFVLREQSRDYSSAGRRVILCFHVDFTSTVKSCVNRISIRRWFAEYAFSECIFANFIFLQMTILLKIVAVNAWILFLSANIPLIITNYLCIVLSSIIGLYNSTMMQHSHNDELFIIS